MSYRGIHALNHPDSHQRKPKLPLVGKRMRMPEALSSRRQAIKVDRHDHLALALGNLTPAWDRTDNGGEESWSVGDDRHSESLA